MWSKLKNSIYIIVIITVGFDVIDILIFKLNWQYKTIFYLIGITAIATIWLQQNSEIDKIDKIMQVKKIQIDGKYPKLINKKEK